MEHFRRENLLFESYIIRNTKDLGKDVIILMTIGRNRRQKSKQEKKKYNARKKSIDKWGKIWNR